MRCAACDCNITTLKIDDNLCLFCLGEAFKKTSYLDKEYQFPESETPLHEIIYDNNEIMLDL